MLGNLGSDMETAGGKISTVLIRLGKLLRTKDDFQIWTFLVLAFILFILGKTNG
jgi:hypothetical protein